MQAVKEERGTLRPLEWATIYTGAVPMTLRVWIKDPMARNKIDVEVDGRIQERLEPENPEMLVNGSKIRVFNPDGVIKTSYGFGFI